MPYFLFNQELNKSCHAEKKKINDAQAQQQTPTTPCRRFPTKNNEETEDQNYNGEAS